MEELNGQTRPNCFSLEWSSRIPKCKTCPVNAECHAELIRRQEAATEPTIERRYLTTEEMSIIDKDSPDAIIPK